MSVLEQWAAFGEQHTDSKINLSEKSESYKGFDLKAMAKTIECGFSTQVCISLTNAGRVKEIVQTPEWNSENFSSAEEVLEALLIYGRAIVDREQSGVDVSALLE